MSIETESKFHHTKALLTDSVAQAESALSAAAISSSIDEVRRRPRTPPYLYTRIEFQAKQQRNENIHLAGVTFYLSEENLEHLAIWKYASIGQEEQVQWWDYREKVTLPISEILSTGIAAIVIPSIENSLAKTNGQTRTTSPIIASLLYELCVRSGFCLSRPETEKLLTAPPQDIDDFTTALFLAEGMDPRTEKNARLYSEVRKFIANYLRSAPATTPSP